MAGPVFNPGANPQRRRQGKRAADLGGGGVDLAHRAERAQQVGAQVLGVVVHPDRHHRVADIFLRPASHAVG